MESYLYLYLILAGIGMVSLIPLLAVDRNRIYTPKAGKQRLTSAPLLAFLAMTIFYFFGVYFIGLRPLDAGFDTPNYVRAFAEIDGFSSARDVGKNIFGNTELLFWPLQSLLKAVVPDPRGWLLLLYTIVFLLSGLAYRYLTMGTQVPAYLFVFVFLTFDLVFFGNAIRQALAFPVGVISIGFFVQRKYSVYLVLTLLSLGLHWSSFVFLLVPVFHYTLYLRRSLLVVLYLCLPFVSLGLIKLFYSLFLFFGVDVFVTKFELYLNADSHIGSVYSLANFWLCLVFAIVVIAYNDVFKQYRALYIAHSLLFSLILIGASVPDFSERFLYAYIFLTPMILYILVFQIIPWRRDLLNTLFVATCYVSYFIALGLMVLLNDSARLTLAY